MKTYTHPEEAVSEIKNDLTKVVQAAVLELLEKKHLYQSATADVVPTVAEHRLSPPKYQKEYIDDRFGSITDWPWYVQERGGLRTPVFGSEIFESNDITWEAPHIKTYCTKCKRQEPYSLTSASNLLNASTNHRGGVQTDKGKVEYYILSYVCQSCRGVPEVFVIRRLGNRLSLVGRGPMEHVEVPKEIPDEVRKFYSGAVVAYQAGQPLSGVFMLRTLIEQWARLFATATDKADVVMDQYMNTLPQEFSSKFPSLREIYGQLSVAIHSASVEDGLFDSTSSAICRHFRARDLFELPGPPKK